ncbi:MAG TPA: FKBP-type peptidyl-prolyl cis-trans isomerase [Cyclobacteriaceae bacterium]|nr:FKBP-type peptidyl-prolyl cis-trans isomerase [Cyclobacteriaceae bacterium]
MQKQFFILLFFPFILSACFEDREPVITAEEQLAIDKAIIEKYLDDNNIEAIYDERGFWYTIEDEGDPDGAVPRSNSVITIRYTGKLLSNGNVFDTSIGRENDASSFQLNNLIVGWRYGLPLMREGAKYTFYFTSGLAYGRNGSGANIPPNANLIFEIELVWVVS